MDAEQFRNIVVDSKDGYAVVRINRPKQLNALTRATIGELVAALEQLDADPLCRCAVITGNDRAFAAGADIGEMVEATPMSLLLDAEFAKWDRFRKIRMPLIAAVSGFALGGGCELAMICDMIVASETAQFGQPEINLGIIPGAGGTQRLTRAVGKARAMEMILTGASMSATEALTAGLVNRVVPVELFLAEAESLAARIAEKSPIAARLAKQAVLKAFDTTIEDGVEFERSCFFLLFASDDQTEGMRAFLEKRPPRFAGR